MTILDCMTDAYTLATGKGSLPSVGSSKYAKLFSLAKVLHRSWQNEPGVDWESLHRIISCGTISATDTFSIPTDIWSVSLADGDDVFVDLPSGQRIRYNLVPIADLYRQSMGQNICASNNQSIIFPRAFVAGDAAFGGTLKAPVYIRLPEITSESDTVQIDNHGWLSAAIASHYVQTDSQLNYLYPDLLAEQNQLMQKMIENNYRNMTSVPSGPFFPDSESY